MVHIPWGSNNLRQPLLFPIQIPQFEINYMQFLSNLNQAYQISNQQNKKTIFGKVFKLNFIILHDHRLKTINYEFSKLN